jgi:hypothetical protein
MCCCSRTRLGRGGSRSPGLHVVGQRRRAEGDRAGRWSCHIVATLAGAARGRRPLAASGDWSLAPICLRGERSRRRDACGCRRDSAFPCELRILPLRHMANRRPHGVPFVVILIADPVEPRVPSRDDVMALCGLSAREAELALCLAKGGRWEKPRAACAFPANRSSASCQRHAQDLHPSASGADRIDSRAASLRSRLSNSKASTRSRQATKVAR